MMNTLRMARIGCILVLCLTAVYTTADTTEHALTKDDTKRDSQSPVCQNNPSETNAKMNAIDEAFSRSKTADFVILIDRSESITSKAFENTKETIRTLMNYLMLGRLLYLHKDYTRLAVLSFGVQTTVEFDGISDDSGTVHACNFADKLSRLELGTSGRHGTNLEAALNVCTDYLSTATLGVSFCQKISPSHTSMFRTDDAVLKHNYFQTFACIVGA